MKKQLCMQIQECSENHCIVVISHWYVLTVLRLVACLRLFERFVCLYENLFLGQPELVGRKGGKSSYMCVTTHTCIVYIAYERPWHKSRGNSFVFRLRLRTSLYFVLSITFLVCSFSNSSIIHYLWVVILLWLVSNHYHWREFFTNQCELYF